LINDSFAHNGPLKNKIRSKENKDCCESDMNRSSIKNKFKNDFIRRATIQKQKINSAFLKDDLRRVQSTEYNNLLTSGLEEMSFSV
jgi:hypothetical protein